MLRKCYGRVFKLIVANVIIVCIFVATKKLTMKKQLPNTQRKRKRVKPIAREIIVLELNNTRLGVYTNTLAALEKVNKEMPAALKVDLPSYSTVNRAVREAGTYIDIPTPVGIYTILRTVLFNFAA